MLQTMELEELRKRLGLQADEQLAVAERLRARGRDLDEREENLKVRERGLAIRKRDVEELVQGVCHQIIS